MIETLSLTMGALLAAIISGATGFGFALAATAMWSFSLEPRLVAVLALVFTTVLNMGYLPVFSRDVDDLRRLAPFALGGLCGVPLGAYALATLPASAVRLWVGSLSSPTAVTGCCDTAPSRCRCRRLSREPATSSSDSSAACSAGLAASRDSSRCCGAACATGTSAASAARSIQSYILFANFKFSMAWIGRLVGVDAAARGNILLGLPFVILGGWLGLRLFARFDTPTFNRIVLWVIAGCGTVLVLNR